MAFLKRFRFLILGAAGRLLCAALIVALFTGIFSPALATSTANYDSAHPENLNDADLTCASAILVEANTGMVVYEKNADARMYPASTTKILTVYLGLLMGNLDSTVTATASSIQLPEDSSVIPLAEGETINFSDLLYATMVKSGNDGANLIAESISGSIPGFAQLMNEYAQTLGCTDTHFTNPSGLHDDYHYTTARDMALIAREAMQDTTFRTIAQTTAFTLPKSNIYRARSLSSTHREFLTQTENASRYYEYANGIKTGNTSAAGHCFVGSATKDGVTFISVVFNTSSYRNCWSDTKKLMEYGFTQYVGTSVSELYAMNPKVLEIAKYDLNDPGLGQLRLTLNKLDKSADDTIVTLQNRVDYLASNFNDLVTIEYARELVAPIEIGTVMGMLTYYPDEGEPIEYELIASRTVGKRVLDFPSLEELIENTLNDPNPFPRFTVEILLAILLLIGLIVLLVLGVKRLLGFRKKPRRKAVRPIGRYYR